MDLQFAIHPLDHHTMETLQTACHQHGLAITSHYLVYGRPVTQWNENVNGLALYLENHRFFHASQSQARLSFNGIANGQHQTIFNIMKKHLVIKKSALLPCVMLTLTFMIIASLFIVAHYHLSGVILPCIAISGLLAGSTGLVILARTHPLLAGSNRTTRTGNILYLVGIVLFIPGSLLTLPLQRAIVQNRNYRLMKTDWKE